MKNPFESPEVFEAIARVDASYFMIGKLKEEMMKPIHPINQMIDKATGFAERQFGEKIESLKGLIEGIIEDKKFVEADYSDDAAALEKLKNLKWKN